MSRRDGKYPDPRKVKIKFLELLRDHLYWSQPKNMTDLSRPIEYKPPITTYRLAKETGIDETSLRLVLAGKRGLHASSLLRLKQMALAAGPEAGFTKEIMEEWDDEILLAKGRDGKVIDKTRLLDPDTFRNKTIGIDKSLGWAIRSLRHLEQSFGTSLRKFLDEVGCSESALYRCEAGKTLLPWPCLWKIREMGARLGREDQVRVIDMAAWHCLCFPNDRRGMLSNEIPAGKSDQYWSWGN